MEREQDTGISILVVGGGIAGLTFAIEAHRKGHNVRVIERRLRGETSGKHETDTKRSSTSSDLNMNHLKISNSNPVYVLAD
jgi:2-polyprenyl-6-methoxyphenol hydroxylase-like FAD-dependent oxidoreductase